MYIEIVPNRNLPPALLLREGWREGKKVRKRTLANLTKWPAGLVEGLRLLLGGGTAVPKFERPLRWSAPGRTVMWPLFSALCGESLWNV